MKMHEDAGGKVQNEKVSLCCWKQEDQIITNEPMSVKLKNETIKQSQVNESIKTLGVYANPSLNWNDDFGYVKNKMTASIKKLMRTEMKTYQAQMRFNMHVLTTVFFWCSIVQFNVKK